MRVFSYFVLGAALGAAAAILLVPRRMEPAREEEWDIVDEASWESFPASDPPAY